MWQPELLSDVLSWRTDNPSSAAADGMTDFRIMQARKTGKPGAAPAAAVVTKDVGEDIVKLIFSEGSGLDKMTEATGLADGQFDVAKMEDFFQDHCAPNPTWPRHRRRVVRPCPHWSVPAALS